MLCKVCNNLLHKTTNSSSIKFACAACGTEYKADGVDTVVYSNDNKKYSLPKNGRLIWSYPANQKVETPCPECQAKIVAFEVDSESMMKIYGCECGFSWRVQTIE